MNNAWHAWKAASLLLFWSMVEWATCAIALNKKAQRQRTVFHPRTPQELFDNGFAVFIYDISLDCLRGFWRRPDHPKGQVDEEFWWNPDVQTEVPWHPIHFEESVGWSGPTPRAVPIECARKNLWNHDWWYSDAVRKAA